MYITPTREFLCHKVGIQLRLCDKKVELSLLFLCLMESEKTSTNHTAAMHVQVCTHTPHTCTVVETLLTYLSHFLIASSLFHRLFLCLLPLLLLHPLVAPPVGQCLSHQSPRPRLDPADLLTDTLRLGSHLFHFTLTQESQLNEIYTIEHRPTEQNITKSIRREYSMYVYLQYTTLALKMRSHIHTTTRILNIDVEYSLSIIYFRYNTDPLYQTQSC